MNTEHVIKIEQALLGCLLINNNVIDKVSMIVKPTDFYRQEHQDIFKSMIYLRSNEEEIDIFTVLDRLNVISAIQINSEETKKYLVFLEQEAIFKTKVFESLAKSVRRYAIKREHSLIAEKLKIMANDETSDPDEINTLLESARELTETETGFITIDDLAFKYCATLEERLNSDKTRLYSCGIPTVDRLFGRFGRKRFILLKAQRGTGKTHILVNWSMKCVEAGRASVIFSLEMPAEELFTRYIAYETGINTMEFQDIKQEKTWDIVSNGIGELTNKKRLYFYETTGVDIDAIRLLCRNLKLSGVDIGFIGIDFAEQVGPPKGMSTREQELARIASGLRNLSNEIDCTVLLLSQVNDNGQERNSRALGNLADLLLSFKCESNEDVGKLISEKNRFGKGFNISIKIDKGTSRMWEQTFEKTIRSS